MVDITYDYGGCPDHAKYLVLVHKSIENNDQQSNPTLSSGLSPINAGSEQQYHESNYCWWPIWVIRCDISHGLKAALAEIGQDDMQSFYVAHGSSAKL